MEVTSFGDFYQYYSNCFIQSGCSFWLHFFSFEIENASIHFLLLTEFAFGIQK